jgi:esterase
MSDGLSWSRVTASPGDTPERWIVFLHGILGQGNNWRGIARRVLAERPGYGAALVDLRAHGGSRGVPPPDDLEAAADDVARVIEELAPAECAVIGHSFGGKVALALAMRARFRTLVVVDSLPGARPDHRGSESTLEVLDLLDALPERFASRDEFIGRLTGGGQREAIAKWLAMNLERDGDGWRFTIEVARIRRLLDDYFERDLWAVIDPPPPGLSVHLVIGGRSPVYQPEDRERALALAATHPEAVAVHVLESAGHWVHVDDPEGLIALVKEAL